MTTSSSPPPPADDEEGYVLRVRGLPWSATPEEVLQFFACTM